MGCQDEKGRVLQLNRDEEHRGLGHNHTDVHRRHPDGLAIDVQGATLLIHISSPWDLAGEQPLVKAQ